jgi:hypothetical protein
MVGAITCIPTWLGWLHLATVIDCHIKAVIVWTTGDNYETSLIEKAIEMAACNYQAPPDRRPGAKQKHSDVMRWSFHGLQQLACSQDRHL